MLRFASFLYLNPANTICHSFQNDSKTFCFTEFNIQLVDLLQRMEKKLEDVFNELNSLGGVLDCLDCIVQ